jgi:hypothetical protein
MQGFEVEEDDIYTHREKEENVLANERAMIHSDITSSAPVTLNGVLKPQD